MDIPPFLSITITITITIFIDKAPSHCLNSIMSCLQWLVVRGIKALCVHDIIMIQVYTCDKRDCLCMCLTVGLTGIGK